MHFTELYRCSLHIKYLWSRLTSAASKHVPYVECNLPTIKERIRCAYHQLPYNKLPKIMIKYMVMEAAHKLNFFPAKYAIAHHYSSRMILHQSNLDFNLHCTFNFGEYVLADHKSTYKNTTASRALDCIYLHPTISYQGGHNLLYLPMNPIITHHLCRIIPITSLIIHQVQALADSNGMPKDLKVQIQNGLILYDSSWTAGQPYNPFHLTKQWR